MLKKSNKIINKNKKRLNKKRIIKVTMIMLNLVRTQSKYLSLDMKNTH